MLIINDFNNLLRTTAEVGYDDLNLDRRRVAEWRQLRDAGGVIVVEHYFRLAQNPEPERRACEIRLRAERKAGQLEKAMEKNKGGRPAKNSSCDTRGLAKPTSLRDLGISYDQSSRWQQLAEVPEERFEAPHPGD